MALLQCAAHNFAGLLVLRLLLGAFEAGFFAGVVFYLTLFYTRGELGFRIAIFFGSALLAAAFSGLISYGVFRINDPHVQGWKVCSRFHQNHSVDTESTQADIT
jgi:MFS family permease